MMTANGEMRTNKETTIYVKQMDLFITVMFLQETPTILSLLRRIWIHVSLEKWSKNTSHQKLQHIKLCAICGFWNISEFFIFITGVNIGKQRFSIR